jgi:hypothetical protein
MGIVAIRDGLKSRLSGISGLRAHDNWPDQLNPPAAIVQPTGGSYNDTFGSAAATYTFDVILVVALTGGLPRAQESLDAYLSPTGASSVRKAIEDDADLNGAAEDVRVIGFDTYETLTIGEGVNATDYLGAIVRLEVFGT